MDRQRLSKKANLLRLNSISLANGMKSGSFRSLYRGQGIEFSGVREYLRGDDVRAIDWNVTARMCRPYVKVFDEERELDVFIIIDKSLSMCSGSGLRSRAETAVECSSLLAMASLHNSSPVGAVVFDGKINFSCAPKGGKDQAMLLISHFEKDIQTDCPGSVLDNALRGASKLLRKRSLVFVISDFRTMNWTESFGRLCQKNDVVAVNIIDPMDDQLPAVGSIPFIDFESGYKTILQTSSNKFAREWREENVRRVEHFKDICLRHGASPVFISTVQDPAAELIKFFSSREQK